MFCFSGIGFLRLMDTSARSESRTEQIHLRLTIPTSHRLDDIHRGFLCPFSFVLFHIIQNFIVSGAFLYRR